MMRKKKAILNVLSSLFLQAILIITNLIIPHFIIIKYGSNVNGLINSITQFLSYVALLEGGIGGVIKAHLYKALAKKDKGEISSVIVSSEKFFKKISVVLILYIIILCFLYPNFVAKDFEKFYTISLLLVIAINSFVQYYFGISNQLLIQADEKGYVVNSCKIITYIFSTAVMLIMILANFKIHYVKAIGTLILTISPLFYYKYVQKNYEIDKSVAVNNDILRQRWDGFAHQISAFIHGNTDITLLTFFSTLEQVSVYSVYSLVTSGLKSVVSIFTNSISATFGNMYANNERERMKYQFELFDYFNLLVVLFTFSIAGFLITPFVNLYVKDVNDANYNQVIFGILLTISEAIYCLRCSYSNIIYVVGDFKETKLHGYIESALNIVISLVLIKPLGLIGIAIGTLIGMTYRWIVSIKYVKKYILDINIKKLLKQYIVNLMAIVIFICFIKMVDIHNINNYLDWIRCAIISCLVLGITIFLFNVIFCKDMATSLYSEYIKKILKRDEKNEKN